MLIRNRIIPVSLAGKTRIIPTRIAGMDFEEDLAIPAKIYGASWNKSDNPILTRTDDAIGMVANAGVDSGVVVNNFDTAQIYGNITEVTDVDGNVFVRIPKLYIRKTDGVGYKTWQVSRGNFPGAYLPKCFLSGSTELPYVDVGKYVASESGGKLKSLANTYPKVLATIVNFRTWAQANGAGYQQLDVHVVDVLQTLFYVEFATLNSQSIMAGYTAGQYSATHVATVAEAGVNRIIIANAFAALYAVGQAISIGTTLGGNQIFYGRTITSIDVYDAGNKAISFDGAAVNIAIGNIVYNTGWKNGFSSSITATSGSLVSNSTGKHACKYRGIENPWGNVWQFVDGLNINALQAWVCPTPADYASNLFAAPYLQIGYVNGDTNGYIFEMGWDVNYPYAAYPTSVVGGAATKYYTDYYYQAIGQRIALLGGAWGSSSFAGVSCWLLFIASSGASVDFGGRLVRKVV
jgi:hypothetical protein